MKKIVLVVISVIVLAAAYLLIRGGATSQVSIMDKGSALERLERSPGDDSALLTTSFRCDNDSSFIATFNSSMDEVTISSEGEDNVFPLVASSSGKVYENDVWSFTFRGEDAIVSFKSTNETSACIPVVNDGDAPMNFGE